MSTFRFQLAVSLDGYAAGREPLEMEGDTTFNFVTDGIGSALERAKQATDGRDVLLGGGANVVQQYLAAGLVDEF